MSPRPSMSGHSALRHATSCRRNWPARCISPSLNSSEHRPLQGLYPSTMYGVDRPCPLVDKRRFIFGNILVRCLETANKRSSSLMAVSGPSFAGPMGSDPDRPAFTEANEGNEDGGPITEGGGRTSVPDGGDRAVIQGCIVSSGC